MTRDLTSQDVADRLGITSRRVIQLADAGWLPCVRVPMGRHLARRFDPAFIARFAAGYRRYAHRGKITGARGVVRACA